MACLNWLVSFSESDDSGSFTSDSPGGLSSAVVGGAVGGVIVGVLMVGILISVVCVLALLVKRRSKNEITGKINRVIQPCSQKFIVYTLHSVYGKPNLPFLTAPLLPETST